MLLLLLLLLTGIESWTLELRVRNDYYCATGAKFPRHETAIDTLTSPFYVFSLLYIVPRYMTLISV